MCRRAWHMSLIQNWAMPFIIYMIYTYIHIFKKKWGKMTIDIYHPWDVRVKISKPPNINFLDSIETIAQHHPPAASRSLSLSSSSQLSERSVAFPTALRCCVVAHPALESPEQWVPFGLLCHLKKGKKSTPRASTTSYRGSSGSRIPQKKNMVHGFKSLMFLISSG